jgi:hypothetical protein
MLNTSGTGWRVLQVVFAFTKMCIDVYPGWGWLHSTQRSYQGIPQHDYGMAKNKRHAWRGASDEAQGFGGVASAVSLYAEMTIRAGSADSVVIASLFASGEATAASNTNKLCI